MPGWWLDPRIYYHNISLQVKSDACCDKDCQQVSVSCLFIKVCWKVFTALSLKPNNLHLLKKEKNKKRKKKA